MDRRNFLIGACTLGATVGCTLATRLPRIVLIGDSTVAAYPPSQAPLSGWGQALRMRLNGRAEVLNFARPGHGTRRFAVEQWSVVRSNLLARDIVLMQFGHIDALPDPKLHADPNGEYRRLLRWFVAEVSDAGARPVLVTPIPRFSNLRGKVVDPLLAHVEAMRHVALETKVMLIDLAFLGTVAMEALGEETRRSWFMIAHDGKDAIHLSETGAAFFASMVEKELLGAGMIGRAAPG